MTSFNVAPFHFYDEKHDRSIQHHNSNMSRNDFSFMCMADYFFKMN